jgi:hypothetical protein
MRLFADLSIMAGVLVMSIISSYCESLTVVRRRGGAAWRCGVAVVLVNIIRSTVSVGPYFV